MHLLHNCWTVIKDILWQFSPLKTRRRYHIQNDFLVKSLTRQLLCLIQIISVMSVYLSDWLPGRKKHLNLLRYTLLHLKPNVKLTHSLTYSFMYTFTPPSPSTHPLTLLSKNIDFFSSLPPCCRFDMVLHWFPTDAF